jgi:hypothetical protein
MRASAYKFTWKDDLKYSFLGLLALFSPLIILGLLLLAILDFLL